MNHQELREVCQASKMAGRSRHPYYRIHRRYSIYLTRMLAATPVTPNQVSAIMIGVALCGLILVAAGYLKIGISTIFISFVLDKCDGELARLLQQASAKGIYLDEIYHTLVPSGLFFAIGIDHWLTKAAGLDALLAFTIAYLVLVCRQEHKASYSVLVKMWPLRAEKSNTTTTLSELKYWIAVPSQDDLVLIICVASFIFGNMLGFLCFYLLVYSALAILGLISALRGDLMVRLSELDPRNRNL